MPIGDAPRGREVVIGDAGGFSIPRQWIVLAVLALLIIVVAGGGMYAWQGPYFKVDDVSVRGLDSRLPAAQIVESAGLYDKSMFTADLSAAQQRIAAMPLVESVKIERAWPHSIDITIAERQPWGTWEQSGVSYTIDHTGVVIAKTPAPAGAPVIKSSEAGNREIGDRVDYQAVDAAAEIYKQLPAVLGTTVSDVSFVAGKGVQVTTADGQVGLFGDSSSIDYKLAVWAAIRKQAQADNIQYTSVDLRFGNRPVVQ
ncbi:FtsQ-type POTRA domain-containing protein [bacterium]|nr:FtsQ-type POTRA domain-containing protein [bacterium]